MGEGLVMGGIILYHRRQNYSQQGWMRRPGKMNEWLMKYVIKGEKTRQTDRQTHTHPQPDTFVHRKYTLSHTLSRLSLSHTHIHVHTAPPRTTTHNHTHTHTLRLGRLATSHEEVKPQSFVRITAVCVDCACVC